MLADNDLSKADLAEVLKISRQAYGAKESDGASLSGDEVAALADHLGVQRDWLMWGSGEMWATTADRLRRAAERVATQAEPRTTGRQSQQGKRHRRSNGS